MLQIVLRNKKGVTLVEVMISLVVLLIVFMGLIQASLLSIDSNVRNETRDEAVKIASQDMTDARSNFNGLAATANGVCDATPYTTTPIIRTFRSQAITFTRCRDVKVLDSISKKVNLRVTWTYRGDSHTHSIISIVRNK